MLFAPSVTHFLHGLLLIYRPRKDERLSWPWLTHSGHFTHKVAICPAVGQAQDKESSRVKYQRSTVLPLHVLHRQQNVKVTIKLCKSCCIVLHHTSSQKRLCVCHIF